MITVRLPAWLAAERGNDQNDFYFEDPPSEGLMIRVPRGRLPEGARLVCVTLVVDPSGGVQDFIEFLREAVRQKSAGRVSRAKLWAAWAHRHDADPCSREVAGGHWKDVPELFRTAFDAGDLMRKRLDGHVSRVWAGYELVSDGDGQPIASTA